MRDKRKDSIERLLHMRNAIERIETFTGDIDMKSFVKDDLVTSAVLFQFSVIGEAVVHIDEMFLEKYDYPWYKVRAFRNLISHEYFNVKLEAVWSIIEKDLPELKVVVNKMTEDLKS
jgi:uncharacterized protein with HEPN domain